MKELFPLKPASEGERERDPKLVGIGEAEAESVFAALSSGTARAVLDALYEEPLTASDIAEEVDTSLQNATYHVNKLRDAGLVDVSETWYSAQGREMKVYAPTNGPLVVYAGAREGEADEPLSAALAKLFGAVGVVALLGALVNGLAGVLASTTSGPGIGGDAGAGGGYAVSTARAEPAGDPSLLDAAVAALQSVADAALALLGSPGGVTFLVGTLVLLALFARWYAAAYRGGRVRVTR
ncbi:transcriptional regulator [Halarchaeum grantii]|uniref:Transcriptional regulator n=1 Tax=Halarchaeum grantii TaxID=1193105 RepID=A0A830ESH8_9EURY|nr:winged helix-turn-helix domain-containing protein [Halarchaeum grantii]GGL25052.1 transcriptional regulator [Halarchaeum grantii]